MRGRLCRGGVVMRLWARRGDGDILSLCEAGACLVRFEIALCSDLLEEKLRLGVVPEVL